MSVVTVRRGGWSAAALWLGIAVFGAIMALLISTIAHTMNHVKPVRSKKPPVSVVVWGDRVFFGPGTLAHWLKTRGIGYSVWAERHPPANHLLLREKARRDAKATKK